MLLTGVAEGGLLKQRLHNCFTDLEWNSLRISSQGILWVQSGRGVPGVRRKMHLQTDVIVTEAIWNLQGIRRFTHRFCTALPRTLQAVGALHA